MPLVQPRFNRRPLEHPPIQLAVAQVQFQPLLVLADPRGVAAFQDAVKDRFPRLNRMTTLELTVGPEGVATRPTPGSGWSFENLDGSLRVLIDTNSLSLETRSYQSFDDLRDTFVSVLDTFAQVAKPGERTRLGLRYVNQLIFDDVDSPSGWRALVRSELLGLVANPELAADDVISHTLGETRLTYERSQLIARYGFLRAGAGVDGSRLERPFFLIDIDNFDVRPIPEVDPQTIAAELDDFHGDIYSVFRWSLTPEGEARLGIEGDVQ
jgi:uncharacterized protein (TIGR04255 family)